MENKKNHSLVKRRSGRERYSREMLRHYKTLAIRKKGGERFEGSELFLKELGELVSEHSRKVAKIKLCKAS